MCFGTLSGLAIKKAAWSSEMKFSSNFTVTFFSQKILLAIYSYYHPAILSLSVISWGRGVWGGGEGWYDLIRVQSNGVLVIILGIYCWSYLGGISALLNGANWPYLGPWQYVWSIKFVDWDHHGKIFVLMSFLTSNFLLTIRFKIMNSRLLEAIILH